MVLGDLLELRTSLVSCAVVRTSSISSSLGNGDVAPPSDSELLECVRVVRPAYCSVSRGVVKGARGE